MGYRELEEEQDKASTTGWLYYILLSIACLFFLCVVVFYFLGFYDMYTCGPESWPHRNITMYYSFIAFLVFSLLLCSIVYCTLRKKRQIVAVLCGIFTALLAIGETIFFILTTGDCC